MPPMKNKEVINLRNRIIPYSLMKIKAKRPPPYSMLNPETISDSPSAVSNGVRLASAIHSRSQDSSRGTMKRAGQAPDCSSFIVEVE